MEHKSSRPLGAGSDGGDHRGDSRDQWTAQWEQRRLDQLHALNVLDSGPEERFDRITRLVARVLKVDVALVSLIDRDRQWFKSACGISVTETPRNIAFCDYALHEPEMLVVPNALEDPRFSDNPLVTGDPNIRFYAGAVLYSSARLPLGTLCVIGTEPRRLSATERELLLMFARVVESELHSTGTDQQDRVEAQLAANVDPITGFFNFREFKARAEALDASPVEVAELTSALHNCHALVVTVEVPRFDNLMRWQGLSESQQSAAQLAKSLRESLTHTKVLFGRHSRNSFIMYLPASTLSAEALGKTLAQSLEQAAGECAELSGIDVHIGVSEKSDTMEHSLNQCLFATERLASRRGIAFACFDVEDRSVLQRTTSISNAIIHAITTDGFDLHYQPKVALASGRPLGMEALLRWQHPDLGFVPPPEIFAVAAERNLTVELDRWVMRTAIRHIRDLLDENISPPVVAINMCCETLHDSQTVEYLLGLLAQYQVPAQGLQIEILETTAIANFDRVIGTLQRLRDAGVTFALDDFGTGYSSLGYLKRLPIETVKLDRSFISQIDKVETDVALARGIIALAHDLGMEVVAEGVEEASQLAVLRELGCDAAQGYYFSKPVALKLIKEMLIGSNFFEV